MAAHLYPGVKSLQLVLDKPYDTIRTTDIRDDLASVKVWYSLTSGFNPNNGEGTLVPSGNSLNVPITELLPGTRYYVKYAFISSIDEDEIDPAGPTGPGSFTISPELTAVVYSDTENVTIYGYLTNDPVPVVTATDGTGGDFTQATGVFKVFNLTEDVTGAGPVYAIKAGSVDSIVGAAIDAVTGVYSCTELTDDGGNVTFIATYNDVVIEQVWNVYRALAGETAPLIQLSTPNKEFIYKDQFATVSLTPSSTITARLVNLSGTITWTAQAYTREGVSLGNVAYTQNGNAITITQAQFDALGITLGTLKVTATIGSVSDVITLYRINDGTEQITVTLSNEAHVIPAYADGTTTPNSYVGSGTIIEVKQGITTLPVDNSSPFANGSWRVTTITADGIVCDITPAVGATSIEYDRHASMDNAKDVATIDYTITGKTTSGVAFTIVKRQSFAKSKEGVQGATARSVSLTSTGQAFVTAQNTTTVTPDTVTLTATQSNFVSPTYTWLVDGAAPTVDIGVATGNTFVLKKFDPLAVKVVKVTVSEGTFSVFDTFSVYSFREGDDAFIVGLKNESQTISCDSAGDVIAGQFPFTTQMYALLGGRALTSTTTPAATFAKVSYNGGIDSTYRISANGIITIDSLDEQFGEAVFSATVNGNTLTKTLNLNKSFDGSDAPVVNVTATTQAFIAAKNTGTISPATVTLTANTYNVGATPTYTWKKSTDGGTVFTTAQTGSSSTFSLASFASGTTIVKVEVSGGASTVFDQVTIYALKEGSDSISVGLVNENQTISCDSAGTPIAGQFNLNSELAVFRGTTKLTSADGVVWSKVAGSEIGMASTIVTTTGAITVTGISATSASSTYRAAVTVGGVTTNFDKTFTLNKSNNGATGSTGTNARSVDLTTTSQSFAYNASGTTPSPSTATVTATAQNTSGDVYYEFFIGITSQGAPSLTNTYTYTPNAAFTSMPQQITVKIREGLSTNPILATDVMSMIGIKPGANGTNAVSGLLTNESSVVPADSSGTVASFTTAGGTFLVFDGVTSKTGDAAVTYSVVSGTAVGVSISIATTGVYTVTGMSADSGTATIRAVYNGVTIDKIYSIAKSKAGATGATGAAVFVATVYRQIASAPTTPTGGSYNFSTNTLTAPAGGWSALQPATTTTPTYACDFTFSGAASSTIDATTWGTPYIEAVNGRNGEYRDTIQLFLSSSTVPTKPTSVQYTFTGNVLGTGTAGWSNSQPSASGTVRVWVTKALASTTTPGTAITLTTWSDPVVVAQNGAAGNATFVGTVYLQNASAPTTPTGGSYNFSTNTLTAPAGGWSALQPATTTTPTYACDFTFSGAASSTIDATTWGTPYIEAVNGRNGEYRDTIQLFLSSSTVPTKPTSVQYTFTGNVLGTQTGGTAGWTQTQPAPTVSPVYMTSALASTTTPGTALSLTSWSDPVVVAQNGRSVYSATVYRQIASVPTTPSGGSYHFGTNTLTAPTDWSATQPASSTIPTYASDFTFSSTASNASVNAGSWGAPYIEAVNGSPGNNGEYRDTIQLFQAATSTPTQPSSASYTFTGNVLGTISGATGTWTLAQPATTPTTPVYMTRALANTTTPGTALSLTSWSAPVIIAQNGAKGDTGNPIFVGTVYLQTTGTPARPSGGSFNFSTSTLTAPAGGWSATQPATTTTPTHACDFTFTGAAGSTVIAGTWSIPYIEAVAGSNGNNGEYRDTIQLFLSSASVPIQPSSLPYTFTGNTIGAQTGGTAGWTLVQPAPTTSPVYMTRALANTTTPGTAVTLTSWSTPVIVAQNGAKGDAGNAIYAATVYQQIASVPTTPSGGSFNFSTNVLTAPTGWSATQPATTTTPTYACDFTFTGAAGSTITATTWSTPYIEAVAGTNGTNGEYRDTIQLFLLSASAPTQPSSLPYTFTGNTIGAQTGGTAGWTLVQPAPTTSPVYMTRALANTTTPGTAVTLTSWSTPVIVAQNGAAGAPGATGTSAAVMYARIAGNPSAVSGNVTVSGAGATRPTTGTAAGSPAAVWGAAFNVTWSAVDPTPTSNNSLYVSDGIYNGTNSTVWSTPYIGSLKVGSLEAITTSTGSLNVTGTFKSNTAAISGSTMAATTSGGIINSNGTFAFGNTDTNITFNGTQLTLNGNVVNTANIAPNSITGSGSSTVVSSTPTSTTLNFNVVIPSDCFLFLLWVDGGEYLYASTTGSGESASQAAGITNVLYTLTAGGTRIIPESTEALALAAGAHHWSSISPTPATYAMVLTMTRPDLNALNTTRNTKARVSWLILKK